MEPIVSSQHDLDGGTGATAAVAEALSEALDLDVAQLDPPLYEVFDPDALEMLFRDGEDVAVSFTYVDHDVRVHGDGWISIRRKADDAFVDTR